MFGGRRFSDLRSGLPGVSANILARRLEGLERVGIIQRRKLPPPASVQIYELTPWGYEAEIILQEMGRWATRSPLHDPTLPLSAASIMMSFRTMYSRERAKGEAATIGFRFGDEAFVVDFGPEGIRARRGEPEGCALVVSTNPIVARFGRLRWTAGFRRRGERRAEAHRGPRAVRPLRRMVSAAREDRLRRANMSERIPTVEHAPPRIVSE